MIDYLQSYMPLQSQFVVAFIQHRRICIIL
jgi:hypothetical protein